MLVSTAVIAFSLLFFFSDYSEYHRAERALEQREVQMVEGVVTDFVAIPPGGHSTESFRVGNASFAYGAGWGSIMFNSERNHGFVHDGAQVRIRFVKADILRVETR